MAKKLSKHVRKQLLNILFLVLLVGVTVTVIFVSQDVNITDVGVFISRCNPWFIVGAFGGLLLYVLFEAVSLHVISHTLGHKSKFASSIAYSTSDIYYSAITPSASGGQPASVYYMMRDGMSGGLAGFSVLFNIIGYTVGTILVGLFAVIVAPQIPLQSGRWLVLCLIIIGFVIQFLLLAGLLLCLFKPRIVRALGAWGIRVLAKMHIVKKPENLLEKLDNVIEKFKACRSMLKTHPMLSVAVLLLNTAQRVAQTFIPVFVMLAAAPDSNALELFCMQAYVMIGYNSIPLPGGTGVYEFLYPGIFGMGGYETAFVFSAMMVSRGISYYICMMVCGLYTLVYHAVGLKNIKRDESETPKPDVGEEQPDGLACDCSDAALNPSDVDAAKNVGNAAEYSASNGDSGEISTDGNEVESVGGESDGAEGEK